ncbi:MAG: beta-propeller fold lactonase family protein [Bacilli bacterium]|nr:beta-propeller fold lactonase family protein [Bacilli bacterium]
MKFVFSGYGTQNETISLFEIDERFISIDMSSDSIASPSFLVTDGENIYTYEMNEKVKLYSYKIIKNTLVKKYDFEMPGTKITHLAYSKKMNILFGCSYADGTIFSVEVDRGRYSSLRTYQKQIKESVDSKCHCVLLNNDENILAVVNIAADAIYLYNVENKDIRIMNIIMLPQGVGPRHAIYNKVNTLMYVITEYSNEVFVIDMKRYTIIQRISTIPDYKDVSYGATLILSHDEKHLYASNRGEETIARFKVSNEGLLEYEHSFACGGIHPRHMILTKDGKFIVSCNKDSNNITFIDTITEEVLLTIPFQSPSGVIEIEEESNI